MCTRPNGSLTSELVIYTVLSSHEPVVPRTIVVLVVLSSLDRSMCIETKESFPSITVTVYEK